MKKILLIVLMTANILTSVAQNNKEKIKSLKEITYKSVKFGEVQKDKSDSSVSIFNNKGNVIEKDLYYVKYSYKYDDKGNNTEENVYNADGNLDGKTTFKYDNKENKIEDNNYNATGSFNSKSTYKYDIKGNNIERNTYNKNGSLYGKSTHKYDSKGNKIEMNMYNKDGKFESKYVSKYDSKGNMIEDSNYSADGSLFYKYTYKYEFDKNQNWIKKTEYKNGTPNRITERKIEYF